MIRWLLAPFFILYLWLLIVGWVATYLLSKFKTILNIVFACFFMLFIAYIVWQIAVSPPHTPPIPDPQEHYRQQLRETQELLNKQPTHRDLLWNAAVLSKQLGQATAAAEYYQRAITVDPSLSPLP